MSPFIPTARSRLKRGHERGHYDEATIHDILDSAILGHVGYTIDSQPFVTPTFFWRRKNCLYWHGSSASRMIRQQAEGIDVCMTVTLLDGLVIARSAFNHSANFRSVMAFGRTRLVTEEEERNRELDRFVERLLPNRLASLRPSHPQELKATALIAMEIAEAVAKIRSGPPEDAEEDYALDCWAGVLPIQQLIGSPLADPRLRADIAKPDHLEVFQPGSDFSKLMKDFA